MSDNYPALVTDALSVHRTRRQILKLLAASAGGLALALGAGPALRTRAQFAPAWTHLAGTRDSLVFYNQSTGVVSAGSFVDGSFDQRFTGSIGPGWTRVVGAGDRVLFYDRSRGVLLPATLVAGQPAWGEPQDLGARWTHLVGTGTGDLLLYHRPTGKALTGRFADGRFDPVERHVLEPGWKHVVGAGSGNLLFSTTMTGQPVTRRLVAGRLGRNVIRTDAGSVLIYHRATGSAVTDRIDSAGRRDRVVLDGLGQGWTHAARAGQRGILFYSGETGAGVGGCLTTSGGWQPTTTYG